MRIKRWVLVIGLGLIFAADVFSPGWLSAQVPWPFGTPTTPDAQRNALKLVQSEVNWLQNATRTAPNYGAGGADLLWRHFQRVRGAYGAFKTTLTLAQLQYGANELAELDAGLDIIQEAFTSYQNDLNGGRSAPLALRSLCRVLSQASLVWVQEFNRVSARLRIG